MLFFTIQSEMAAGGRAFIHVFELRKEIKQFLRHRGSGTAGHFENEEFILSLAQATLQIYSATSTA